VKPARQYYPRMDWKTPSRIGRRSLSDWRIPSGNENDFSLSKRLWGGPQGLPHHCSTAISPTYGRESQSHACCADMQIGVKLLARVLLLKLISPSERSVT
jgi:hypothetical protein